MKIVIPAYEPDNRLINLIEEIREFSDYEIILVNDGSNPECDVIFDKAAESGCIVLKHKVNRGKGAALKTAYQYLLENSCAEGFICADCDGQHTWRDIKKIAEAIPNHTGSMILGCRNFIGDVPFKSKFGNRITRMIFSLITGNKISDTQTGLRGFSSEMLPWLLQLGGERYEYEMNQLLQAKKNGYSFHCIPIDTIYENNNEGSHFHPIRDSIRVYLPILKFSLSSITCGILDFALLFLFKHLSDNLLFAVISARVISSLCNYLLNKHIVFEAGKTNKLNSLIQYYLLAVCILGLNYLLLSFLNESIGVSLIFAKLLTEAILFLISYTIQHYLIFKENNFKSLD